MNNAVCYGPLEDGRSNEVPGTLSLFFFHKCASNDTRYRWLNTLSLYYTSPSYNNGGV